MFDFRVFDEARVPNHDKGFSMLVYALFALTCICKLCSNRRRDLIRSKDNSAFVTAMLFLGLFKVPPPELEQHPPTFQVLLFT